MPQQQQQQQPPPTKKDDVKAQLSVLVSHWIMLKISSTSSMFNASGKGTEDITSRIDPSVLQSLAYNIILGRSVKYHCVQRAGSTKEMCD